MAGFALLLWPLSVPAAGLPDYLYLKDGVVYPRTGDSSQEIFHVPANIRDILQPGMLLGVLPEGCSSASKGTIGDYYICPHNLLLQPEERHGKTVYRVLDFN
jgi:hypothetical protein